MFFHQNILYEIKMQSYRTAHEGGGGRGGRAHSKEEVQVSKKVDVSDEKGTALPV
jgi:hypothetical protein